MTKKKQIAKKSAGDGVNRRIQYYEYDISILARKTGPYEVPELYIGGVWEKRPNIHDWDMKADEISEADAMDWIAKNAPQ